MNEKCIYCLAPFEVEAVPPSMLNDTTYELSCPHCDRQFVVANLPRIAWKRNEFDGSYYTTLVHRYAHIDGFHYVRFEYYD